MTSTEKKRSVDPTLQMIAGFTGGTISTVLLHPLDLARIRFQLDRTSIKHASKLSEETTTTTRSAAIPASRLSTIGMLKRIYVTENGVKGLYRGVTPSFLGSSIAWGMYFWAYTHVKQAMASGSLSMGGEKHNLSALEHMSAAAMCGAFTACFTNPLFVVKTRFCASPKSAPQAYQSTYDAFSTIARKEGIHGFYRGMVPALIGVSQGAFQFMAYEELKQLPYFQSPTMIDFVTMAVISKVFSTLITYPYHVIRSRIQNSTDLRIVKEVSRMWKEEGRRSFYKGLTPNLIRVLPSTCITMGVYEFMTTLLEESFNKGTDTR